MNVFCWYSVVRFRSNQHYHVNEASATPPLASPRSPYLSSPPSWDQHFALNPTHMPWLYYLGHGDLWKQRAIIGGNFAPVPLQRCMRRKAITPHPSLMKNKTLLTSSHHDFLFSVHLTSSVLDIGYHAGHLHVVCPCSPSNRTSCCVVTLYLTRHSVWAHASEAKREIFLEN